MRDNKGFTLIELLAIITILGVIMAIAIPSYQHYVTKTRKAAYNTLITTIRTAAQNKYIDEGLPTGCQKYSIEEDLYKKGYMDKPADPASTSNNCKGFVYIKGTDSPDSMENYKILVSLGCSTYNKDDCKDSGGATCTFSDEEKNECGYEIISGGDEPSNPDNPDPTNPPMIKITSTDDTSAFRSDTYREKIKTITLDNKISKPANTIESWDIGVNQNGDVMAYITKNLEDESMYNLYIQGDGVLYANPNSEYLFSELKGVDSINGLNKLNTSKVTNMSYMFHKMGERSTALTLDLGNNFDTSNVTNMQWMFTNTGYASEVFSLNLGNKFDTSNVTNMSCMFCRTGSSSLIFTLDLGDKFNTSKVTNMSTMFYDTGGDSPVFTLNLGNKFDTSHVTTMSNMFDNTGYKSNIFSLNLGNKFDTSNVTNMKSMFYSTGYCNPNFKLDLGDKFNTSKVTTMSNMFELTGYFSTVFTLDLGNKFDTSNVTDMRNMFYNVGKETNNLVLDLSTFNFNKVIDYNRIFYGMTTSKKIYVKDSVARNWIINNSGNSNLTTSNVLIKS